MVRSPAVAVLGFFSDVDIKRRRRFLGGARFTVGAIVRVLFMRRYDARIRFRPLGAEDAADAAFFLEDGSSDDDDEQDGAFYNKFDISRSRKRKGSACNVSGAHRMGNPRDSRVAKRAAKAAARGATAGVEMPATGRMAGDRRDGRAGRVGLSTPTL